MTLQPLFAEPGIIQIHALVALVLVPLTIAIFVVPRGRRAHRIMGWSWVIGMGVVAASSFWIHSFRLVGPFSPIHLLSVVTLVALVTGVRAARGHRVSLHRKTMRSLVFGALVVAGAFTLLPGRVMHAVLFGG